MSDIFDTLITGRASGNTFYNVSDLNRVEEAVKTLAQIMCKEGYYNIPKSKAPTKLPEILNPSENSTEEPIEGFEYNVDPNIWNIYDFPTDVEMDRYLKNLIVIRRQLERYEIPLPDTIEGLTYTGANDIESLLVKTNELIKQMKQQYRLCNTFKCGEGR